MIHVLFDPVLIIKTNGLKIGMEKKIKVHMKVMLTVKNVKQILMIGVVVNKTINIILTQDHHHQLNLDVIYILMIHVLIDHIVIKEHGLEIKMVKLLKGQEMVLMNVQNVRQNIIIGVVEDQTINIIIIQQLNIMI